MFSLSLTRRLALVFAVLLLVCSGTSIWLQVRSSRMHELEVVQGLSRDLARHIASDTQLMDANGLMPGAVRELFSQLMLVNPSVEVYLLDIDGRIIGDAAPRDRLLRDQVDLAPIKRFIAGEPLPIVGDDPRSLDARKVFSVAPLMVAGQRAGFLYVVLLGEAHDRFAARGATSEALSTAVWAIGLIAALCLLAGLAAFAWITRPLRRLTTALERFDIDASAEPPAVPEARPRNDEIGALERTFAQMQQRLAEQLRALNRQEQERRELVANISHDLRTPLASLHGYLEVLSVKGERLSPQERRRYLGIALDQSHKVGGLAQALLELVRLEHGFVKPVIERFSAADLLQDVLQKFELTAATKGITLEAKMPRSVPDVYADLGLIERVLTNLLDNALRHTPQGGSVTLQLEPTAEQLNFIVADSGPGIAPELREGLFLRPFTIGGARRDGGLGLRIVYQILQLHGAGIELLDVPGQGAVFRFGLSLRG
ncbi:HAMP domain-containing histidine kinase [Pseudomonas sp. LJDD11]|uniref:HAMP domain-containing sensor histidine kinase n=1 Tax=unclassified Pseudomonas TaxID=196821 RepID=UPI0004F81947|nr:MULTISPECIES: HAMP domain-containing sensor histidine kinase [unclassified Pseudomonas]MCQ9424102.1 HAMP domain-containing histidine kinase [Pseudomonas sp. LJDD11]BAP40955.1 His Kinase A phosphoacceptor [Pseudomonas sp. StFLB209]